MSAAARSTSGGAWYTSGAGAATILRVSRSLRSWVNTRSGAPMSVSSGEATPEGGGVPAEGCALVWEATAVTIKTARWAQGPAAGITMTQCTRPVANGGRIL